ncbi:MAG TPA: SusE domain-containing protein, partial [Chryseosolibacter sp.]|nr:SusE domain-containing protein [Chryseosolibacter sp.]
MKKILYSFLIVFVAIVSCEQEEFPGSGLESLRDFTLTPVPNSRIALNSLAPDEEISITWQQARSGFDSPVTYTWMFDEAGGDFSNPLISLPSDNDGMDPKITFTNAELEAALADAAVSAGSEIHGIWAVRATNGDVTKTSASNVLAMMRYSEAVMTFDLIGPETNRTVFLKEAQADEDLQISWEATVSGIGTPITYNVIFDEVDGDFSDPVLSLESDDDGAASTLTKTQAEVEDLLAGIGVDEKSKIDLKWTVVATAGEVTQMANEPFNITLVRWGTELRLFIENVPDLAPSGKEIFAAGSFGFLGNGTVDWQTPGSNPALQLSKNEADGTYYLDINVPKGTSFEYKFALATTASPTWDNGEQQLNAANDGCEGIANRQFTFDGTQDVVSHTVVSWERFCPFDVVELIFELKSYPEIPAGYDVYMAGSFGDLGAFGTWNQPGTNQEFKMTKGEDNVYRKTFLV